jgi:transposase
MSGWAKTPMDRNQVLLFNPTLDATISENHPVRLYDEILRSCDWSAWESQYVLVVGQPPMHPRVVASVILYGLSQGIRSSRVLERQCRNSLDYLRLARRYINNVNGLPRRLLRSSKRA